MRILIMTGSILGTLAVLLGAFGAHGLTQHLDTLEIQTFQTANRYHFYHVFAILITALLYERTKINLIKFAGLTFCAGIVLFSGSLYLLATKTLLHIESWSFLGPVTPIGGLCFVIGWILIFTGALKKDVS